ncbi:hypothetical protein [Agaribacterium sp. ZY112]|uniref:hypothetical protein n=1 Tax=Agaribacterium sp. ZY112 TaxID=3233574 RepID=UPI0035265C70
MGKFKSVGKLFKEFVEATKKIAKRAKKRSKKLMAIALHLSLLTWIRLKAVLRRLISMGRRRERSVRRSRKQKIKEVHGNNIAEWTVDEKGRPVSVEGPISSTH